MFTLAFDKKWNDFTQKVIKGTSNKSFIADLSGTTLP